MIQIVCEELVHEFWEGEASVEEDSCFAVLGEDDVVGGERGGGADGEGFFAGGNHVERETALTLGGGHGGVEDGDCEGGELDLD